MLGGGARHDAPGVFFAFSADIGIRPLHGALIASISYSMQLGDSAYFWSGGLQLEIDLSHVFASHVFTCLPDRDRRWGFSVGGRMGITGAISHAQLYDGFERVRYGLIRPEWMFFAELRARIWAHWKPGRVFVRAEEHTSLEFTPSRLAVLAGFSFDFDV